MYICNTDVLFISLLSSMKKYASILFLFLSVLVMANPVIDWSCTEKVMTCGMDMSGDSDMSCCAMDMEKASNDITNMMCCPAPMRVVSPTIDLTIEVTQTVDIAKEKKANIKAKWFNSNYLSDWRTVDLTSVTPTSIASDGFKFKDDNRLDYICTYRI